MTVTELTKTIYEKYQKVWEKLKYKYHKNLFGPFKNYKYIFINHYINICDENEKLSFIIDFNLLYGLLEDFFEENGIYVTISHIGIISWNYYIDLYNQRNEYIKRYFKSKTEAKLKAILKSCEIFEGKL